MVVSVTDLFLYLYETGSRVRFGNRGGQKIGNEIDILSLGSRYRLNQVVSPHKVQDSSWTPEHIVGANLRCLK